MEWAANTHTITVPIANHDNQPHLANENSRLQNLWDVIETMATSEADGVMADRCESRNGLTGFLSPMFDPSNRQYFLTLANKGSAREGGAFWGRCREWIGDRRTKIFTIPGYLAAIIRLNRYTPNVLRFL